METFTGAKGAFFFGDELVVYLRDNKPGLAFANMWDFPGGGREGNETPFECLAREVDEEFGIFLKPEMIVWQKEYPPIFDLKFNSHFFVAKIEQEDIDTIKFGNEGQYWQLMTPDEFLGLEAVPYLKTWLQDYLDSR
jgi:8-oxo-dGTP diphosphatase